MNNYLKELKINFEDERINFICNLLAHYKCGKTILNLMELSKFCQNFRKYLDENNCFNTFFDNGEGVCIEYLNKNNCEQIILKKTYFTTSCQIKFYVSNICHELLGEEDSYVNMAEFKYENTDINNKQIKSEIKSFNLMKINNKYLIENMDQKYKSRYLYSAPIMFKRGLKKLKPKQQNNDFYKKKENINQVI